MIVRVALIGYGYAGRTFHAPLIRATPGLELAAVASHDADRVHKDLPGIAVLSSPDEACATPSIDLVVIATPNDTHAPLAAAALRAGKHVVVDKPLAPTLAEARTLADLAGRADRVLATFQNRRWDGDFLALTDLLARGELGEVSHFESHFDRFRPEVRARWREQPGVGSGVWYDLGPHLVDQALQLFGLPDRVFASFAAQRSGAQTIDWAHVVLEHGRRRAVLHASMIVAARLPRFIVHGSHGSWIKYGFDRQERELVASVEPSRAGPGDPERASFFDGAGDERETPVPSGDYTRFYAALRDAVLDQGPNPVPPAQAVAVTAVIETAIASAAEQRVVSLPLSADEVREFRESCVLRTRT
jgi:predicted dehydrogenase